MRRLVLACFLLFISHFAQGQSYTISTFAGGGLPISIPGTAASLTETPGCVAVDRAGNLFLVDQDSVLRLDAVTGIMTLAAGNGTPGFSGDGGPATSAQLSNPLAVAVDSVGTLYIADTGNYRIRKVTNGVITTVAGNGTQEFNVNNGPATGLSLDCPGGLAVDGSGNLYFADACTGSVRRLTNGVLTTVAGNGSSGSSGNNGSATSAQLIGPSGLAVDSAGDLYISDTGNHRILEVSNGVMTIVAGPGPGTLGFTGDNGPATDAQLCGPGGVAVDSAGNLYIADTCDERVRKVSNGIITTVAGNGTLGFSGDNGPATDAALFQPNGVAVDSAGNLFIADTYRIRKVSNGVITTVAGTGTQGFSGDNGQATRAQLDRPESAAVDAAGNVYIADTFNYRVRAVSNGVITTIAGNGTSGFSGDGGPAASSELSYPTSVAVDSMGNLYVGDSANYRIRRISNGVITTFAQLNDTSVLAVDSSGNLYVAGYNVVSEISNGIITVVAGDGIAGFSGDGGPATSAQLNTPLGLAVDSAGNLYISDFENVRIRKVTNGVITTVAGNGTNGYSGDGGPATKAQLNGPLGLAVDPSGSLFVVDSGNEVVRKVSNGVITTVAGNGTEGFSGDGGPATAAELDSPWGIAAGAAGSLYLVDSYNNRIRLLVPSGPSCSATVTPSALQPAAAGGSLNVTIQTSSACPWAIQSLPSWITYAGNALGTGSASVTLSVAANSGVTRSTIVSVAGVSIPVTQPGVVPSISAGGIVNAASFATSPVAPGSIASVYGNFLLSALSTAPGQPVPSLAGLSLQFGSGLLAPLFAVSGSQVNFQVPWELTGQQQASVSATVNGQTSNVQAFSLAPFAPGIFTINAQGTGQGAILDPTYRLVDASNPATAGGTVIQIYCTGLGPVTNQPATGAYALSEPLSYTTTTLTITIGGAPATVQYSGLAPGTAGGYQVNALVPAGSSKGTAVPVVIKIGNAISNTATIAVQ